MAFATASGSRMVDMNITPLVDVMLVLLIIFMVTVPALDYATDMDLRKPTPPVSELKPPEALRLHIGAGDTLMLDGQALTLEQLQARLAREAARGIVGGQLDPMRQPALELVVEPEAEYELVARVLTRARNANLARIGFAN